MDGNPRTRRYCTSCCFIRTQEKSVRKGPGLETDRVQVAPSISSQGFLKRCIFVCLVSNCSMLIQFQ